VLAYPAGHNVHAPPEMLVVPATQLVQVIEPAALNWFAGHGMQGDGYPAFGAYVFGGQPTQKPPIPDEVLPGGQSTHSLSDDAPSVSVVFPLGHAVQLPAVPALVEYQPMGHGKHPVPTLL
jgi:hypothetical protein